MDRSVVRLAVTPLDAPTARELGVLIAVVQMGGNRPAARALGISEFTVRGHLCAVRAKLRAANTAQAFAIAIQRRLVDPYRLVQM